MVLLLKQVILFRMDNFQVGLYNIRPWKLFLFFFKRKSKLMKWGCDHRSCNRNLSNCKFLPEKKFQGFNGIRTRGLCESTAVHLHFIYIPAVQISTSIHVSFLSRVKMNSINCSTANTWVFIAHLVEHCSANAEAMAG